MIAFSCGNCGMKFQVKDEFAGRSTSCSTCKNPLVVPTPAAVAPTICAPPACGPASSLAQGGFGGGVTLSVKNNATDDTADPCTVKEVLKRQSTNGERYVVEGELARGGMGVVVRAVDCDIRREVALKFLLDPSNPNKTLRFIEEAQITGQLEHPNIVPVHELGIDAQKRVFFSMKMVKGRSLAQILDDLRANNAAVAKVYTLGRLLNVLVGVSNALAFAHSLGVVHRDLKPANIMVGDFGEVYVMDWGLAKLLRTESRPQGQADQFAAAMGGDGPGSESGAGKVMTSRDQESELTMEGTVLGTPVYMPPEQASGQIKAIGPHSDVYSLGAMLYEILTLEAPVDRTGGFAAILQRVIQGEIMPPHQRNPARAAEGKIPAELSAIAMKALARDPRLRYASVEAMRRDIELFQEGRTVSAKEDTRREMLIKFVRRNRALSGATAAATAVVLIILITSSWFNFRAARAAQKAYADQVAAEKVKDDRTRRAVPAIVESAQLSLERRRFDNALTQVRLAIEYDPNSAEAHLLQGQILLAVNKDFAGAKGSLDRYLKNHPEDDDARNLRDRCNRDDPSEPANLLIIAEILTRQQAPALAEKVLSEFGENVALAREFLLKSYRDRIHAAWEGQGNRLTFDAAGHLKLRFFGYRNVTRLTPLIGMPIAEMNLQGCGELRDLGPLRGMPLKFLNISDTRVSDLSPLRGAPMVELLASDTPIHDLTPLKGMRLTAVNLSTCANIHDITPLAGMPIERLSLRGTKVSDIAPLKGMPLTHLSLYSLNGLEDISPLKGMKLKDLDLAATRVDDLSVLAGMPLTTINLDSCMLIRDISPLAGMPLKTCGLSNCKNLRSIGPLKGMKLTTVNLHNCPLIQDISPLKGMNLSELALENCQHITDLSPIAGMQLTYLNIMGCTGIKDLTPLTGMSLTWARLPSQEMKGIEILQKMPTLRTINNMPAEQYWKNREAKGK